MSQSTRGATRFQRACFREPVDAVPAWLMRQAGRYLPAYQALKQRVSFWELCRSPELAARATLDAADYLETDAAIIFSDITLPGWAMGLELEFAPGPRFASPIRAMEDVKGLRHVSPHTDLGFVMDAIRQTRAELDPSVSLIGFVGAPFTLAGYMVEGTPSRSWRYIKAMAYDQPDVLEALLHRLAETVAAHAQAQVEAGCDAVQLFDTSAGELAEAEVHRFAFSYAERAIAALQPLNVPIIYFARHIGPHLEGAAQLGQHVLGLDWTVSVASAAQRVGGRVALMGNLDPTVLFTTRAQVDSRTRAILEQARNLPGFVLNLGHGVLPETPPENAKQVIMTARAWSAENRS